MPYPSLLYGVNPSGKVIPSYVFEDLQLMNFFDSNQISTVKIACDDVNRNLRLDFFNSLEDECFLEKIRKLYDISGSIGTIDKCYDSAASENIKAILFVYLMKYDNLFGTEASEIKSDDKLSISFCQFFSSRISGKKYIDMVWRLEKILPMIEKMTEFTVGCGKDETFVSDYRGTSYISEIIASAEQLGIKANAKSEAYKRAISPDIIETVVGSCPEIGKETLEFYKEFKDLYSDSITFYRGELGFYITAFDLISKCRRAGVSFCRPTSSDKRIINAHNVYDISLIAKNETDIVPNDVLFCDDDSVFFFLTGANGGGKTTYLRAVGIMTVFYLIGCPIPAESAQISGVDSVYTHFPRDERFDGSGRFVEEDKRVRKIVEKADTASLVLLNETYSTTNEENAVFYTQQLSKTLFERNIFGLYITHQHGLTDGKIPYLQVLIDEDNENKRTFKVVRSRNKGGSFAYDILKKYDLTAEALEKRFSRIGKVTK